MPGDYDITVLRGPAQIPGSTGIHSWYYYRCLRNYVNIQPYKYF